MNSIKEKELIQNIDITIHVICEWIQSKVANSELDQYPTDMIKALAELVSARALFEKKIHYCSDSSNE